MLPGIILRFHPEPLSYFSLWWQKPLWLVFLQMNYNFSQILSSFLSICHAFDCSGEIKVKDDS